MLFKAQIYFFLAGSQIVNLVVWVAWLFSDILWTHPKLLDKRKCSVWATSRLTLWVAQSRKSLEVLPLLWTKCSEAWVERARKRPWRSVSSAILPSGSALIWRKKLIDSSNIYLYCHTLLRWTLCLLCILGKGKSCEILYPTIVGQSHDAIWTSQKRTLSLQCKYTLGWTVSIVGCLYSLETFPCSGKWFCGRSCSHDFGGIWK